MVRLSLCVTLVLWLARPATPSYRHLTLNSPEVCPALQDGRPASRTTVQLQEGAAAVLTLAPVKVKASYWKCDLKLKASPGHGLMVGIEGASLRESPSRPGMCLDFIQFGRDDNTPFYTWDKSARLCGKLSGRNKEKYFHVSNGELLVWLRLGDQHGLASPAAASLVVTQYQTGASGDLTSYRSCQAGDRYIRQEYFCDGRVNCVGSPAAADESPTVCDEKLGYINKNSASPSLPSGPPLNLLSITLVLVSATVLLFLFFILIVRLKMSRACQCSAASSSSLSSACELPDQFPRLQVQSHPGPVSTIPLSAFSPAFLEPGLAGRGSTPDTEPPPAYTDLFPQLDVPDKEEVSTASPPLETVMVEHALPDTKLTTE